LRLHHLHRPGFKKALMTRKSFALKDFDYALPSELIAQRPSTSRSGSRLLVMPRGADLRDDKFAKLPELLRAGDLLVFNDSKVIPARLHALKQTGGAVELLVERITSSTQAQVMLRASKKPSPGALLKLVKPRRVSSGSIAIHGENPNQSSAFEGDRYHTVTLIGRDPTHEDRFVIDFEAPVFEVIDRYGELPLPPYIAHDPTQQDSDRYQTVYAQHPGSVAAPTAGLHFDKAMLDQLDTMGVQTARVTLHVGSGTFAPVRTEDLSQHQMHSEWCSMTQEAASRIIRAKAQGRRVIAVGTTSLRTLESWAIRHDMSDNWDQADPETVSGDWETDLFITPGYSFKVIDALLTNFHLPKSTLLMLVSAFAGYERIREAYRHAIDQRYRFFSYGDAMFLERS
jgi:S-adenosylmethionine:tRNA ribosyltransferase-isomerase